MGTRGGTERERGDKSRRQEWSRRSTENREQIQRMVGDKSKKDECESDSRHEGLVIHNDTRFLHSSGETEVE